MRTGKVTAICLVVAILTAPFSAVAQGVTFTKPKLVVQEGDKSKERNVALVYADGKIVIKERKKPAIYKEIPYSAITDVTYERSTHPRWKTAILLSPLALFSRGKKHWLTISYQDGDKSSYALLKLDKNEYQRIIATTETEVGIKIERIIE